MIFPWLEFKDILLTCVCDCEGLRDDRRADIIQLWEKKKTSWESKSIHCAMKPIRMQLECPL